MQPEPDLLPYVNGEKAYYSGDIEFGRRLYNYHASTEQPKYIYPDPGRYSIQKGDWITGTGTLEGKSCLVLAERECVLDEWSAYYSGQSKFPPEVPVFSIMFVELVDVLRFAYPRKTYPESCWRYWNHLAVSTDCWIEVRNCWRGRSKCWKIPEPPELRPKIGQLLLEL